MVTPLPPPRSLAGAVVLMLVAACGGDAEPSAASGPADDAGTLDWPPAPPAAPVVDAGTDATAHTGADVGSDAGPDLAMFECGISATVPNPWIQAELANVPQLTGDFTKRTSVELPRLVHDATVTHAKYGFDFKEAQAPTDPRLGLVNVRITDLVSSDGFGASFQTSGAAGASLYLSNVYLEPNWPTWVSYDTTNYDGMVLDHSEEIFAEDLTVKNWNADTAADIKSKRSQFVCLRTEGDGHRTLRYWNVGPHYLVKSSLHNGTGDLVWMQTCTGATVFVYDSTFNGASELPADKVSCNDGGTPRHRVSSRRSQDDRRDASDVLGALSRSQRSLSRARSTSAARACVPNAVDMARSRTARSRSVSSSWRDISSKRLASSSLWAAAASRSERAVSRSRCSLRASWS